LVLKSQQKLLNRKLIRVQPVDTSSAATETIHTSPCQIRYIRVLAG